MADKSPPDLVALGPILNQLFDEAVANGMDRPTAIRRVTKIVNEQWKAAKFEIYGSPVAHDHIQSKPR